MRNASRTPRLAAAVAGSLAIHGVVFALLALLVGIGASGPGRPFDDAPLRATLARPEAPAAIGSPPPVPPTPAPARAAEPSPARAAAAASRAAPLMPAAAKPAAAERYEGLVSILPDDGSPLDPGVERVLGALHPGATRGLPEFDVPPVGRYPEAARAERRQVLLRVVAIVHEDGSLELLDGTVHDPVFLPAIREALAGAKAQPPLVDGTPRRMWTLLAFYFEFYASGESQRSRYEPR